MSYYNGPKIVTDGLLMYVDAGNPKSYVGSGTTWTDLSGNNYNGTLTNGPTFNSNNIGSFSFDGTNDYVLLTPNFFNHGGGTPFSVSIWFKANSGNKGIILGQQDTNTPTVANGWVPAIYIGSDGKLYTSCFWGGDWNNQSVSTNAVDDGTYKNITVTFASTVHTSYLNGIPYATLSKTQNNYGSVYYYYFIGSGKLDSWPSTSSVPSYFTGNVAHFSFYTKQLSSVEVLQNYNATKTRFGL